ncbi:MAG TPA: DUF6626 family protein [Candidatus Sulfotelmatobacter sp.]|jgi:hypothetical protein|nr:DUF6626 family protein [Candidatus Sulfotelmatobacter sp.]
MLLIDVRDKLIKLQLTDSQMDFSVNWLGMGPSYMSCLRARNLLPSAEALLTLGGKLTRQLSRMRQTHQHAEAAILDDLNKQVWAELMRRYSAQPSVA